MLKNDIWRIVERKNKAYCENCNTSRTWYPRKVKADEMTSSQTQAVERIRSFFDDSWRGRQPKALHRFEIELDKEFGRVQVTVETSDNYLISQGGMFHIGRRGGVKCLVALGFGANDKMAQHYTEMVKK